jgi:hypothetical protein
MLMRFNGYAKVTKTKNYQTTQLQTPTINYPPIPEISIIRHQESEFGMHET